MNEIKVFIEAGTKKTVAGAVDWPGWARNGKDEPQALQALLEYGPRYARVLAEAGLAVPLVRNLADLRIVERYPGNATTNFGGISAELAADSDPVDPETFSFFQQILTASWAAFDKSVALAEGRELRKGPRGGGRDLPKIMSHVLESERAYLRRIVGKFSPDPQASLAEELVRMRQVIMESLARAVNEGLPEKGPRGGKIWAPRHFVRHVVWHTLDHAWEIEDRLIE